MKKLISLLLALTLVLSLASAVFAEEETTPTQPLETGSITINNVTLNDAGEPVATYALYRLLDLESYSVTAKAYSYLVNPAWAAFFVDGTGALDYVAIDKDGYVTWTAGDDEAKTIAFSKLALAFAKEHSIAPVISSATEDAFVLSTDPETGNTNGTFSDLTLGYYLVDTSMGALCGLTTTNPHAEINAKNGIPTIDKQVMEDSTSQWSDESTADIGQTVYFRTTINVHPGAENYILHDTMSAGLTFLRITKIEHIIPGTDSSTTKELTTDDYTLKTAPGITESTEDDTTDGSTFQVIFDHDFCEGLKANQKLVVYYEAMLNRNAIVANDGNPNQSKLQYGENHFTTTDSTKTYTFGFDVVKTDSQNTLLDGAMFKIYDKAVGGNEVPVVILEAKAEDGNTNYLTDSQGNFLLFDLDGDGIGDKITEIISYRRARADETGVEVVVQGGKVRIVGFDNGNYYLEETKAPAGYNKLTSRKEFIIADKNLDATFSAEGIYSTGSGVWVVNKTGTMLPETGSIGTTLFITFGAIVVLGAGMLLVTKKRMNMIQD